MPGLDRVRARRLVLALVALFSFAWAAVAGAAPVVGFIENWPGTSTQGWDGGAGHLTITNPGTGGVDGAADGYLSIDLPGTPNNFGARSFGAEYTGDWLAAGVKFIKVWLKDVGAPNTFELHVNIGNSSSVWQYNVGFIPTADWTPFLVDLQDSTAFTHTVNGDGLGFAAALQNASLLLIRNDNAPYVMNPNPTSGDVGYDHVELLGGTTGVGSVPVRGLTLRGPQPNPSFGPVSVALETAEAGAITFEVVDLQGRLVRRATVPAGAAGLRTWQWDGRDSNGRRVAAGNYRVRALTPTGGLSRSLVRLGN